jgi:tRNA threonylcarbamoyladenosine biosynthesis protein TsaB
MEHPLVLAIETSTKVCSVALLRGEQVLAESSLFLGKSHAEMLLHLIDQLFFCTNTGKASLDAIAISEGPGSYTGLRIGTSTAKGLCFALDIPLISVDTLEAMAFQIAKFVPSTSLLCPMIDARRLEVYSAVFAANLDNLEETRPVILDEHSYGNFLTDSEVYFFGDGSMKAKDILSNSNAKFIDDIVPNAITIGLLALEKYERGEYESLAYFEPFYLKEFHTNQPVSK